MNAMNWPVVLPELWLLAATCAVLLIDVFAAGPGRRLTFWLTQGVIAVFAWLHLQGLAEGATAYGMQRMVVRLEGFRF